MDVLAAAFKIFKGVLGGDLPGSVADLAAEVTAR
jgi:hypothetical protein